MFIMEMLGFEEVLLPFTNKAGLVTQARHLLLPEWIENFSEMMSLSEILMEVLNRDSFKPITDKLGIDQKILKDEVKKVSAKANKLHGNPQEHAK